MWIYHNLFIHLPVDGHLGYFQFGAIMNNVTKSIFVYVFVWEGMYIYFVYMEMPGHILSVCLTFKDTAVLGFPGGTVVKNPPANAGDTGLSPAPGRSHMPRSN